MFFSKIFTILFVLQISVLYPIFCYAFESMSGLTGLYINKEDAYNGYTLFVPAYGKEIVLIDMKGRKVHAWKSPSPVFYAEILDSGNIIASIAASSSQIKHKEQNFLAGCGRVIELDWEGNIVWDVTFASPEMAQHHALEPMPNGNILMLAMEFISKDDAIALGRDPKLIPEKDEDVMFEQIIEVNREGKVIWKWKSSDHLGLGYDKMNPNFIVGVPNVLNGDSPTKYFNYFNGISYNAKTDQIAVTCRNFGEILVIDHKTGKISWRFGNPGTYGGGALPAGYLDAGEQVLFGPHDPNWLPNGNISVFNNGTFHPTGKGSAVMEINPATNKVAWEFSLPELVHNGFYSPFQSAAQKLPNGNYFVTSSQEGHLFEVTPSKEIVWEYVVPVFPDGPRCAKVPGDYTSNSLFRAYRYSVDHAAFAGRNLIPGEPLNPGCPEIAPLLAPYLDF